VLASIFTTAGIGITKRIVGKFTQEKMMNNKVRIWFMRNGYKLTWALIGWRFSSGIRDLMMGNFIGAIFSFGFAYLNYILNP
jgi:hypothetical protein